MRAGGERHGGHRGEVACFALTRDGKRLFTGGYNGDGTTRLWDVDTGQELYQLLSCEDGAWAVFDKDGRYDSSDGAVKDTAWRTADQELLPLNDLRQSNHDPGLLAKYLG